MDFELLDVAIPETLSGGADMDDDSVESDSMKDRVVVANATDWCIFFEESDFRAGALQVRINTEEMRLSLYDTAISAIVSFIKSKYGLLGITKQDMIAIGEAFVSDDFSNSVLSRLVESFTASFRSVHATSSMVLFKLYTYFESVSVTTDFERMKGILGQFVIRIDAAHERANRLVADHQGELTELKKDIRVNAPLIRTCLEHTIRTVEEIERTHRGKLESLKLVTDRADILRQNIVRRIEESKHTSANPLMTQGFRDACYESVKRIVLGKNRGIMTQIHQELFGITRTYRLRYLYNILPQYLGAVDIVLSQLQQKRSTYQPVLTREADHCKRFIGETRMVLEQLDTYFV